MNDIADQHIERKGQAYWDDLVSGTTSRYKEAVMERLIREHFAIRCDSIIDIGCGTCDTALKYKRMLGARRVVCTDYDAKVVAAMRDLHADQGVEWQVADIFALRDLGGAFDLVFLMDMMHEVYSFYGRPDRNPESPVDHALGMRYVGKALREIASIVSPKGGVVITDDVLSDEQVHVTVRMKRPDVVDTVRYFLANYPTRQMDVQFAGPDIMTVRSRDLNILLTQYNKIKTKDWDRWNIERFEIHEYMSETEFRRAFDDLGFDMHAVVGTPDSAWREWNEDFQVVGGLPRLPEKRITLLAIKR